MESANRDLRLSVWQRQLLIGVVVALTSQVHLSLWAEGFRVSAAAILYPVLLITLLGDRRRPDTGLVTGLCVLLIRVAIDLLGGMPLSHSLLIEYPGGVFYLCYDALLCLLLRDRRSAPPLGLGVTLCLCDFVSNLLNLWLSSRSTAPDGLLPLAGLALLLGWAVVRARRWWLVLAFTLPPLLPGLLADLYPDWPAFMALSACWCVMLLTGLCKWAAPTGRGKLTLIVFPCVGLVLLFITVMFPREGYTRPAWALRAQEDLRGLSQRASEFFAQWEGPFGGSVTYVGAAEEADLSNAGPLRFSGRTVLRFITDYDGRLYLRGSSLAVYEDGVWTPLPEGLYEAYYPSDSPPAFPLYFPAMQEQDSPTYTITVNNVGTVGACVYAPYFPVPQVAEDTGALPVDDAYLARKQGQWEHTLDFVERTPPAFSDWDGPYISFDGPSDGQMAANQYAEYAYSHYLDVPEELRETLNQYVRAWFSTQGSFQSAPGSGDPVQLAEDLGAFLSTFCEYDPETPAPPEGVDPVDYFLNESHRGYCMHYASAVALMLRTQGIPARYVSGFTAESVPNRQVDVPDRAAHAWVEVWVDGFGWHPVEVTPAAAFTWYEHGVAGPSELTSYEPVESLPPEPTPTPVPTPAPDASAPPSASPASE